MKCLGFAETAWGSRGVYLGSDLSVADWSAAVDLALGSFERSPFVLQRYIDRQRSTRNGSILTDSKLSHLKAGCGCAPFIL